MEDQFAYLVAKIEAVLGRVHSIDRTLVRQEQSLADHIRRTELAEESIKMLRTDFKPVQKHIYMVNGILKFIGFLTVVASLTVAILKITAIL